MEKQCKNTTQYFYNYYKDFSNFQWKFIFEISCFLKTKLEILGSIIENGKIGVNTANIEKLLKWNLDKNTRKDVQKIIGFIN